MARFEVLTTNLPRLTERIETLNKKAVKLGTSPIVFIVGETERRYNIDPFTNEKKPYSVTHVEVSGEAPHVKGWTFIATLEPVEGGNLIKKLSGEDLPLKYRNTGTFCDHCGTDRYRKEVFVVRHEDGTYKQVGRNCLGDFLGGINPETLAKRAEFAATVEAIAEDDWFGGSGGGFNYEDTTAFLATVNAVARRQGFLSRTKKEAEARYGEDTTADWAWGICTDKWWDSRFRKDHNIAEYEPIVAAGDVQIAEAALEWARTVEATNDYFHNLKLAVAQDNTDTRSKGIIASAIPAYHRTLEQAVEKAKRPEIVNEWVGKVGDKITFKATISFTKFIGTDYGTSTLIKFIDEKGRSLTWFASGEHNYTIGETVEVKGTVNKLDEYQGTKTTQLTRCKVA